MKAAGMLQVRKASRESMKVCYAPDMCWTAGTERTGKV